MTITTRSVQIPSSDIALDAYLALPDSDGPHPAVIVFQEIFGVNSHIREVTERLAQEGYVAIAPALYQRQAPGFETGYTAADIEIGRKYKDETTAAQLLADTQATIHYLSQLPDVNPEAVGCIGFCFGGHVAYLAATLPEIKATASFYGAGIATSTPGGGPPTLTKTPEIKGTLYAFFGDEDASIPLEEVTAIETELKKYGVQHHIFRYPADHGFFCDHRGSYDAAAAHDALSQVKALFQTVLSRV